MISSVLKGCIPVHYTIHGLLDNNVYYFEDNGVNCIVDPTRDAEYLMNTFGIEKLDYVIITHGHWDHCGAANDLRKITNAKVIASAIDAPVIEGTVTLGKKHRRYIPCPVDIKLNDKDTIQIGSIALEAILTPGHTPGSMCLYTSSTSVSDDSLPKAPIMFSGDTLFYQTHGRTDFEGGSPEDMVLSLRRLATYPDNTIVLPGHGRFTSIGAEKTWIA